MTISGSLAGRSQHDGDQIGEGEADAAVCRAPSAHVQEDPRAAPRDDRIGVVADDGEVAVRDGRAGEVFVGDSERRP
jgi:hypothetical protein